MGPLGNAPDSTYSKRIDYNILDQIERETFQYQTKGEIIIMGDINARTGINPDFIANDNHDHLPLEIPYTLDAPVKQRQSQDKTLDDRGKHLLELCIGGQLRILNGRKVGDLMGYHTSYQYNGSSTVDYGICSLSLFNDIPHFKVHNFIGHISDHCMISLSLTAKPPSQTPNKILLKDMPKKFKWSDDSKHIFENTLSIPCIQAQIAEAQSAIKASHDATSINDAVHKFNTILTKTAQLCLKHKKYKPPKSTPLWCTSKLKSLQKSLAVKAQRMSREQTGESRRAYYLTLKQFRKELKYTKRHQHNQKISKLNELGKTNPKEFWKVLQSLKDDPTQESHADKISPGDWYDYLVKHNHCSEPIDNDILHKINNNLKPTQFTELDYTFKPDEIHKSIKQLKNNKSPGLDSITNEMLKCCNDTMIQCLTNLFNKIYSTGNYPDQWCEGYITNIHKKGSHFAPENYRSITITSALGKLFNTCLNTRLQTYLEQHNIITPQQIGFEKGSSTIDHLFTFKTIIDKHTQTTSQKLYTCFIDFRQAFDKIWHQGLLYKLTQIGINNNFFTIIKNMYSKTKLSVKTQNRLTNHFSSNIGVRQGDNLSPTLFNIYINDLALYINKQKQTDPVTVGSKPINCLMYADDVVLISTSKAGLQNCINCVKSFASDWKLQVNMDKTKVIIFNKKGTLLEEEFHFGTDLIECTNSYTYLGLQLNNSGCLKHAVDVLYNKCLKAMFKLNKLIDSTIDIKTILHIFDHTIKPIILYGSEIWGLLMIPPKHKNTAKDIAKHMENNKLAQLEINFYKKILGVKRTTSNLAVRGELGRHPITIYAIANTLKYIESIKLKPDTKLVKQTLTELTQPNNKTNSHFLRYTENLLTYLNTTPPNQLTKTSIKKYYNTIVHKLQIKYEEHWHQQINLTTSRTNRGGNKLRTYNTFKQTFHLEPYLLNIDNPTHKKNVTKLRVSVHPLNIEALRGTIRDPNLRSCPTCTTEVEDEKHFTMKCPIYAEERNKLLETCFSTAPNSRNLSETDLFTWIMSNENKSVCKALGSYTTNCLSIRKNILKSQPSTV